MNATAQQKIAVLTQLGAERLVDDTISKLITLQMTRYQFAIQQIAQELQAFEKKFKMSSQECYQQFNNGMLGDDADVFEWVGLYENVLLYQKRLEMLESVTQ